MNLTFLVMANNFDGKFAENVLNEKILSCSKVLAHFSVLLLVLIITFRSILAVL